MKIDSTLVRQIDNLLSFGLCAGLGDGTPGNMCVEALICNIIGEPHGDNPSCVDPAVRAAKITINDASWSSCEARAKGMRDCAIAQLGSRGVIDQTKFALYLSEQTIRRILPIALRAIGLHTEAGRCADEGTAKSAKRAAESAKWAAGSAEKSAEWAAEWAAESAEWAAESAKSAAKWAAKSAAKSADYDAILELSAEIIVEALIECGSPGASFILEERATKNV